MIRLLLGSGGVVSRVGQAVSKYNSGQIDDVVYIEELYVALDKLSAFDRQLMAKIPGKKIVEPEASQLLAASSDIRATIESLIAKVGDV